ncbi:MAG: right-handed parallel beta-helix repeat-containing protein, partial [Phycisphaerales bacterium]
QDVGIAVGSHSHVSDSVATLNGTYGIYLSFHSVLIGSTAVQNDEHGVGMYSGCRVTDCTASANGWDVVIGSGFYILGENNHLEGCVATRNWEHGFVSAGTVTTNAVEACTASENGDSGVGDGFRYFQKVVGCVANNNPGDGISLIDGVCTASSAFQNANHGITALFSTVADCDANSNGADGIWADDSVVRNNSVALNTDDGIEVGVGCHVWGNKSAENQDDGIEVGGDGNNIEGNNLYNNLGDAIDTSAAGGNSILSNRERGNPGGYNLNLAADTYGRIFAGPGMVNTGVAADHFVNISY